jgi:hypothetical protein
MRPSPKRATLRRFAVANRVSRDRPEAAAELVRLEYERQRLSRAIEAFDTRRSAALEDLALVESRIIWVHGMLGINDAEPAPVAPAVIKRAPPAAARAQAAAPAPTRRFR